METPNNCLEIRSHMFFRILSISGRCASFYFFEHLCKIKIVTVANLSGNGKYGLVTVCKKPCSMFNPQTGQIADKGSSCFLTKNLTGIIRIDTAVFCKILYGNIFLIMLFCINQSSSAQICGKKQELRMKNVWLLFQRNFLIFCFLFLLLKKLISLLHGIHKLTSGKWL